MMRRYDCNMHGNFVTNANSIMCPRCLDKESRGEVDVKPFELNGTMGMYKMQSFVDDAKVPDLKTEEQNGKHARPISSAHDVKSVLAIVDTAEHTKKAYEAYLENLKTEELSNAIGLICELPKTTEGRKDDQAKPDLSLLPKEFLEEVAKAFMHGEKKYGRYNYRAGMDWHRLVAACLRHISAFNEGEDTDSESNYSHLGHAGACIAMLLVYQTNKLGKDTRYKP